MKHLRHFEDIDFNENHNERLAKRLQYNLEKYFGSKYSTFVFHGYGIIHFIFHEQYLDNEKLDTMFEYLKLFNLTRSSEFYLTINASEKFLTAIKNKFVEVEMNRYNL